MKTRLAAGVGEAEALRICRELGRGVIDGIRPVGDCTTVVAFTPAHEAGAVRTWLGPTLRLEPQCEGDLGARLHPAVGRRFAAGAERVAVIGTDCPDVDARIVDDALARLDSADVVLGPSDDGGYYLLALRGPVPDLFTASRGAAARRCARRWSARVRPASPWRSSNGDATSIRPMTGAGGASARPRAGS